MKTMTITLREDEVKEARAILERLRSALMGDDSRAHDVSRLEEIVFGAATGKQA